MALTAGHAILFSAVVLFLNLIHKAFKKSPYTGIPGPKSKTWMGFLPDMHDANAIQYHYKMPDTYGHIARLKGGLGGLQQDALYVTDPLALNSILIRDQYNFPESHEFRGLFGIVHHGDPLPCVNGSEHKRQRKILNPIFTASHVAKLAPLFYNIAGQLCNRLNSEIGESKEPVRIDMLDHLTRTALELISQGGIGHSFKQFDKDDENGYNDFIKALRTVLPWASRLFLILPYLHTLRTLQPEWLRHSLSKMVDFLPWNAARRFKWCTENMHPVFRDLYYEKKAAFEEHGIEYLKKTSSGGNDLASVLMQANADAEEEDVLSDELVIATYSAIIHGGQETTSGALSRLLTLMAQDLKLQNRLRAEINSLRAAQPSNEEVDHKSLDTLPLLDAVTREFLRLYPPVTFVWRQTLKDCIVPLQFPFKDTITGEEKHELLIHKGTSVYVGLAATNMSSAIWGDDAHKFKPERWLNRRNNEIKTPGIFGNMMTFLGGGRACPGMKFAMLEMKLLLFALLPVFEFSEAEEIVWRLGITVVPTVKGQEDKGLAVPVKIRKIA